MISDLTEEFSLLRYDLAGYWKRRSRKYFNKSNEQYRVLVADHPGPKLRDALVITWDRATGIIHIKVKTINIPSKKRGGRADLIEVLRRGAKPGDGAYVVALNARVKGGKWGGLSNKSWLLWLQDFCRHIDSLNPGISQKIENKVRDDLQHLIDVEEF